MSDHDLATLLREHVASDEPPFLMSPETVIAVGRRTLVRRRARRGLAGVLVAAAVAAVPLLPWIGSGGGGADRPAEDPTTSATPQPYDARRMPAIIDQHVRTALGDGMAGLGRAEFIAFDDRDRELSAGDYERASGMSVAFRGTGDRQVEVTLKHAHTRSEADVGQICAQARAAAVALSCSVTTAPSGDPVAVMVQAVRPGSSRGEWSVVSPAQLRDGADALGPIDPATVRFERIVESVRSSTFLTTAREIVRAPDLRTAQLRWQVPVSDLETVVTDPALVLPAPRR